MKKIKNQEITVIEILRARGSVTLHETMGLLDLSESTVRRIFARLEEEGCAVRFHGGIRLAAAGGGYSYDDMRVKSVVEKRKIAAAAAAVVKDGDILYIDSGTTMAHLSAAIAEKMQSGYVSDIRIFTNSLVNLDILSQKTDVSVIGGEYRVMRRDFSGYITQQTVRGLHFTKCFLGSDGYHPLSGFTATDINTARVNEIAIKNSSSCFVLIDSSKFMNISNVPFSKGEKNMIVVTDCKPENETENVLFKKGVKIIICDS